MRKSLKALVTTAALIAGLATTSVLRAEESGSSHEPQGPMMGGDSMNMMDMMHMMEQMPQMSQMMEHCSQVMDGAMGGGSGKPNEQWRKDAPINPDDEH